MQRRRLGNSDLSITPVGFGAWALGGGGWAFAWGPQDDADSVGAIREALDLGINWIDTAAVYGLGHSEEVVAKALEGVRNRPFVFTKCARVWDAKGQIGKSLKAESIRRECEASLRRLKVDVIDLYQLHWPEPPEDIDEGWQTMVKLKEICGRHGKSAGEVAIAWTLRHPAVTGAIVGARRPGQLRELIGAAEWRLTPGEVGEIEAFLAANPG